MAIQGFFLKDNVYENRANSEMILAHCFRFEIATKKTSVVKYSPMLPDLVHNFFDNLNLD